MASLEWKKCQCIVRKVPIHVFIQSVPSSQKCAVDLIIWRETSVSAEGLRLQKQLHEHLCVGVILQVNHVLHLKLNIFKATLGIG